MAQSDQLGLATTMLSEMSGRCPDIKLFSAADRRLVARCEGRLAVQFDPELLSFFEFSNGASVLDYCIAGCKNKKLIDIDAKTRQLWAANPFLAARFVGFMSTSAGEHFGMLADNQATHHGCVGWLPDLSRKGLVVVAESFSEFMVTFLRCIDETISSRPGADLWYIAEEDWQLSLLNSSESLRQRYSSGEFDTLTNGDEVITEVLRSVVGLKSKRRNWWFW